MASSLSKKMLALVHLLAVVIIGGLFAIWYYLDIGCVLRAATGIPCPTCGATRAVFSLLTFDLGGYFYYHPMAVPIVIALLLGVHIGRFKESHRRWIVGYVVSVVVLTLVLYVFRLVNGLIP